MQNDINIQGVGITFSNGFVGLEPTNLHVDPGLFCTLLGPSGSGKTTLLRAIAGLVPPTSGRIIVGGRDVTTLPVQARNMGFVFQNYALFPHMNVFENIEYPLKVHGWQTAERTSRVKEILQLVELDHVGKWSVGQLSGGQQQRVAIGRALAYRPSLLLLDEPMGALDRRLRQQLGASLREIQQRTGITTIYVTHDQEEAFILSDKIAVMSHGKLVQYSSPTELYSKPRSRFVAEFLGEANLIDVLAIAKDTAKTNLGAVRFSNVAQIANTNSKLTLLIRPEDIKFAGSGEKKKGASTVLPVRVEKILFLGSRCVVTVAAAEGREFLVECAKHDAPKTHSNVWITWDQNSAILLNQ